VVDKVTRLEGSMTVLLTIRGTREERVRDRDTRVKIALSGGQAARVLRLLGERLTGFSVPVVVAAVVECRVATCRGGLIDEDGRHAHLEEQSWT
jgi:hypothetical protein